MTIILAVLALIVLIVSNLVGCGTPSPQTQFTATPTEGYAPIEAQFTATPTNGHAPIDVRFSDLSTGEIDAWQWDFNGDGVVDSTLQNPEYTYNRPDSYTVSLTVIGPGGNATNVKVDYLKFVPYPRFVDFIAEPTTGAGTTVIQFTDKTVGIATSWAWDFESDGIIDSTERNPTHAYTRNGAYSVTLTITTLTFEDAITKWDYIIITGCST
jgi:PKD repeat protein